MFRVAAFQLTTTAASTDVFSLEVLAWLVGGRVQWSAFATVGLSLGGFLLASTTTLSALVSTTVERDTADSHTLRRLIGSLVADGLGRRPCTPAGNFDFLQARQTFALMTELLALVTTSKHLAARLVAVWYRVFATCSSGAGHIPQRRLATRTACDDVWRSGTMRSFCVLWVTCQLAAVLATVEGSTAPIGTLE
jgi:hypothetical protein